MVRVKGVGVLLTALFCLPVARANVDLIAIGSVSGAYGDLSTERSAPLENGVAGNRLGGLGSGIAYAGGTTFLTVPDRGPNAVSYNAAIDDTASYINRFQTFNLSLAPSDPSAVLPSDPGSALPFVLTPTLRHTTLLSSRCPWCMAKVLVWASAAEPQR